MQRRIVIPSGFQVAAFVVSLLVSAWSAARAVVLLPGDSSVISGMASFAPGTVIADDVVPFTIYVSGSSGPIYFQGSLQRRVIRSDAGDLAFAYRIRDTVGGFNGQIRLTASTDFTGFITDCDFSTTGSGTRAPQSVSRSADGSTIQFDFGTAIFAGPIESRFMIVKTNARYFDLNGSTRVVTSTGQSAVIPTYRPVSDSTPPVADIVAPGPFACVCNPVAITGTANDPDGTFDHYDLTAIPTAGGAPIAIASSSTPVVAGTLASWDITSVPQAYYFIRLDVYNIVGLTSSDTTLVWVDKQFDALEVRSPAAGSILGGIVCFDGSAYDSNGLGCFDHYTIEYAPLPAGAPFHAVDPGSPTYTTPVINDPLGQWNTRSGGAAVADGNYRYRVVGFDDCGHTRTISRDVSIDNTAPVGVVTSPANCANVMGVVPIIGSASDVHLVGWTLQYTGGDAHTWVTIATGSSNITNALLANWDTRTLRPCAYTVRLLVSDASSINCGSTVNQTEYSVSVNVGCPADFNRDNVVNSQDFFDFLNAYFVPCP
jgi:hypothetical protein